MEVLATYFFEIEYRPGKKIGYADYLSRINQTNSEYLQDRKDAKYILNVLYIITDKGFNCDIYTTDIGERISQWIEPSKNEPCTFYMWAEWEVLANQAELIPSLITFKEDIRRVTCKKGKQPEHPIHKITIIKCSTCRKIVEENQDHYCLLTRKTDLTTLVDKPQWDITHVGSQIPSDR